MSNLQPQDVVIAAFGRSAVGRAKKGSLKYTHPVDFGGQVLRQVLDKLPQLNPKDIADVIIGCSKCEEVQGYNIGRLICLRAGLPYDVPAQTVNRFCSSGLQTIYSAINMIRAGDAEVMVAGGVETMSMLPMGTKEEVRCAWIKENEPGAYMPMGLTAENVAELCHVTREEQDALALESHRRAAAAQDAGVFQEQILPVQALDENGNRFTFDKDEASCRPQPPLDLLRRKSIPANSGKVLYHDTLSASTINGIQKEAKPRPFEGKPVCKIMKHPHNCMSMTLCDLFQAAEMTVHQLPVHIIWAAAVYTMINKNLHSASPFPNGACTIFPTPSGAFHTVFIRPSSNT